MEFINKIGDNYINKVEINDLYEAVKFCINTNFNHYKDQYNFASINDNIISEFNKELIYFNSSTYYTLNYNDEIIGSIRTMKYDSKFNLPLENIYNISIDKISTISKNIWHIGRFAINQKARSTLNPYALKLLLMYAITPIYCHEDSIVLAECDCRLASTINQLGIKTKSLGMPINYLGSDTIPIMTTRENLVSFYETNKYLVKKT